MEKDYKKKALRTAIFIDGGYLDKVLKIDFNNARIDYNKLVKEITKGFDLFRTYYYYCMPYMSTPPTPEEKRRYRNAQQFIFNLNQIPRFELRKGILKKRGENEFWQKRVDNMLTVDLTRLSWNGAINQAILISGDDDNVPAVMDAKDAGVAVILYYLSNACSRELHRLCDERIEITKKLISKILR